MNRLFVAYKPSGISSNGYLSRLKREFSQKRAGYSGTLDPFAQGVLVVGFGSYTKLFRFLKKSPKTYIATLWLGAKSDSLDIEMAYDISIVKEVAKESILELFNSMIGDIEYMPPKFSAKKLDGKRAYDLARDGLEFELKNITSTIYKLELLNYSHPFLTFSATVSEGTYIRSLGEIIAKQLGFDAGCLSYLLRAREGEFVYNNQESLNIREFLLPVQNFYNADESNLKYGRVLELKDLSIKDDGYYYIDGGDFLSIIRVKDAKVSYELGRIEC